MHMKETDTRQLLIESFKDLILVHSFNKITIKMITDKADVIRPTFYNHFQDKYEMFEIILEEELFGSLYDLMALDMPEEATKMIFSYFNTNWGFYQQAFKVTGQNSFEDILTRKINELMLNMLETKEIQVSKKVSFLTREQLVGYYSINLVLIVKMWLQNSNEKDMNVDEIFEAYTYIVTHDFRDFFEYKE